MSGGGGLDIYSGNLSQFQLLHSYHEKNAIVNIFNVIHQVFFSMADNQLFEIDNNTFIQRKALQMKHSITAMIFYKENYLFAWSAKGYGVYDKSFQPSSFLSAETQQMQDVRVTSLALGSEDILWYGTDGSGIIKIYPKTKSFDIINTSDNGMPYNGSARAFCQENENLWVGTKGSGRIKIQNFWPDAQPAINKQYFLAPAELDNNAVYALKKGNDELVYFGTDGKGVGVYDYFPRIYYINTCLYCI